MSSAANHSARSHRSQKTKQATFGTIHRKAVYRSARKARAKSMRQRVADFFARMRKPKESKSDKL